MQLKQIHTQPDPYVPFLLSQGIQIGNLIFISGQAAMGDDGEIVGKGDFDRQADQAMKNLDRVLQAAGSSMHHVVKVTIFLTSMGNLPRIVEMRRKWFSVPYPADSLVEVSGLYSPDAMIEIEAVAVASGKNVSGEKGVRD